MNRNTKKVLGLSMPVHVILTIITYGLWLIVYFLCKSKMVKGKERETKIENDNEIISISEELKESKELIQQNTYIKHFQIKTVDITSSFCDKTVMDYVVLDLETTGLNSYIDEITEVCILKFQKGQLTDKYCTLVKPKYSIPSHITEITGINDEMVQDKKDIQEYIKEMIDFIGDNIIIGYNVTFDLDFLKKAYRDSEIFTKDIELKYIDILQIAKERINDCENYKLSTLKEYYNISNQSHRAEADCLTTNEIFKILNAEILQELEFKVLEQQNRLNNLKSDEKNFIEYIKSKVKGYYEDEYKLDINIKSNYYIEFFLDKKYLGKVKLRGRNYKITFNTKNQEYELDNISYDEACKHSEKWFKNIKPKVKIRDN